MSIDSWRPLIDSLLPPILLVFLGAISSLIVSYVVQRWTQTRSLRTEYVIRNMEKTFIPLYGEITNTVKYFQDFFEEYRPTAFLPIHRYEYSKWNEIEKDGLNEIMRIHDRQLYDQLEHFYIRILPKLVEFNESHMKVRIDIQQAWESELEKVPQIPIQHHEGNEVPSQYFDRIAIDIYERFANLMFRGDSASFSIEAARIIKGYWREKRQMMEDDVAKSIAEALVRTSDTKIETLRLEHREIMDLIEEENVKEMMEELEDVIGQPWRGWSSKIKNRISRYFRQVV